jgi:hypothetical protein
MRLMMEDMTVPLAWKENDAKKCWRSRRDFWYYGETDHHLTGIELRMKTFVRNSRLFLIAACAAAHVALAQTTAPAGTNQPPTGSRLPASKRFSGKIASLDPKAKSFTLEGPVKDEILTASTTTFTKNKQPATFEDLAVGQQVNGMKRPDASTNWVASRVIVGAPRQIPPEPPAKQ